jgi:prephenate dehydrogenase
MINNDFDKIDILIIGRGDIGRCIAKAFRPNGMKSEFIDLDKNNKDLDTKCRDKNIKFVIDTEIEDINKKRKLPRIFF